MAEYLSDEEQVEALKRWWKENGTSIIAGLVIGLGGVFGWQAWGNYQDRTGKAASQSFNQMLNAVTLGDLESSGKQAELLRLEHEGTNYAIFAALGVEPQIEYFDMPDNVRDQYQYFTQARMDRLREAGYDQPFTSLEDGVRAYVQDYLETGDPYR